jgi:hypothetical protein
MSRKTFNIQVSKEIMQLSIKHHYQINHQGTLAQNIVNAAEGTVCAGAAGATGRQGGAKSRRRNHEANFDS